MSYSYLLTLSSIDSFFFGGEHTFGADEKRGEISRYHAKTRLLPSQSSIIGMLRRAILISSGVMKLHKKGGEWVDSPKKDRIKGDSKNYKRAIELVGRGGFIYRGKNNLGIIEYLSPIMIKKDNIFLTLSPKDLDLDPYINEEFKIQTSSNQEPIYFIDFKNYNPKEGLREGFIDEDGNFYKKGDIFQPIKTFGIKKSQNRENSLFMKDSYKFKDNSLKFAIFLKSSQKLPFEKIRVELGADRSSFILEAKNFNEEIDITKRFKKAIKPKGVDRVVALSELLVPKDYIDYCNFIFGSRVAQRQIVRRKRGEFKKGEEFFRYEAGTVLYPKEGKLELLLENLQKGYPTEFGVNKLLKSIKQGSKDV